MRKKGGNEVELIVTIWIFAVFLIFIGAAAQSDWVVLLGWGIMVAIIGICTLTQIC